jgi:hypothetical protein
LAKRFGRSASIRTDAMDIEAKLGRERHLANDVPAARRSEQD